MKKVYPLIAVFFSAFSLTFAQINNPEQETIVSDFENLYLESDSFWNGSDGSGVFTSGMIRFPNSYDPDWGSWSGWAYSNMANDSTPGFSNQYSTVTASGYDTLASGGSTYGVSWVPTNWITSQTIPVTLFFTDTTAHLVTGCYVTNSTYAALSMEMGDDFSKKFGGETGNDPDWFRLSTWGYRNGTETDTIDFYLADYRFENNLQDYVVKSWEWVDLNALGSIDSLKFNLSSSDVGLYGMNTPAYFCVDHIVVVSSETSIHDDEMVVRSLEVFPNPTTGEFRINTGKPHPCTLWITDVHGNIIHLDQAFTEDKMVNISHQPAGIYVVRMENDQTARIGKVMKR